MSPTSSMSSHPEKASLMLRSRATVDRLLFLVIYAHVGGRGGDRGDRGRRGDRGQVSQQAR